MSATNKTVAWISGLHRFFAMLHGASVHARQPTPSDSPNEGLLSAYAAYAEAVVKASAALRTYGDRSEEFKAADVASMRLFHRVKKAQGLKMPGRD